MKRTSISRVELERRLFRSVLAGLVFAGFALGTFIFIRYGPREQHLPQALRDVQVLNEKVGRKLVSLTRAGRAPFKPAPPKGKEPRINGLIGLSDDVDPDAYRMIVESGSKTIEMTVDDIEALPRTEASTDFKCVEGWTEVFQYAGVRFSDFMKLEGVGRHEDGSLYPYVGMETPDGRYYVSLDMASMMAPDTILVWEMNGGELSVENGYPVRLMIPSKYGIKSLKRIGRIFFSDTRPPDYWNRRGYDWFSGL
jgi:DMSO/TMAO reductase YedYZ molybdopterin-dependent catalytic subunit